MATEIAILPVRPGITPEDPTTDAGQRQQEMLNILYRQPGYQRCSFGRENEDTQNLRMYIDWDKVEDHKRFMQSTDYVAMIENAQAIVDMTRSQMYHVHLKPHPATHVLLNTNAPFTEAITWYFPDEVSQVDRDAVGERFERMSVLHQSQTPKPRGTACGWVVEKLAAPGFDETGFVFVGFIGWDTVDDSKAHLRTDIYKEMKEWLASRMTLRHEEVAIISLGEGTKNMTP